MKDKTDIWLCIIVGLMCAALFLAIAAAIYGIINQALFREQPSNEYERGYMDGFRNGMLMDDTDYGTIKLKEVKNE